MCNLTQPKLTTLGFGSPLRASASCCCCWLSAGKGVSLGVGARSAYGLARALRSWFHLRKFDGRIRVPAMKMYHTAALGPQAGGDRTQMTTDQPRGACPKKGPWGNLRMTSRRIPRDRVTYVRLIAASDMSILHP